jgi:hypothetical protein
LISALSYALMIFGVLPFVFALWLKNEGFEGFFFFFFLMFGLEK